MLSVRVTFGEFEESVEVEALGSGRFRLLQTPLLSEKDVGFGDVVALDPTDDGLFCFRSLVSRSNWVRERLVIGPPAVEKKAKLMDLAEAYGANLRLFHRALDPRPTLRGSASGLLASIWSRLSG